MYVHDVLSDVKRTGWDRLLKKTSNIDVEDLIYKSQKFHLGDIGNLEHLSMAMVGTKLFLGENAENIRLPFRRCWFDWNLFGQEIDGCPRLYAGVTDSKKRAILCIERAATIFEYMIFYHTKRTGWMPAPAAGIVFINGKASEPPTKFELFPNINHRKLAAIHPQMEHKEQLEPVWTKGLIPGLTVSEIHKYHAENMDELLALNVALKLLNCRNIKYKLNRHPRRNKLIKKGKDRGLYDYHTLFISTSGKATRSTNSLTNTNQKTKVHLCRGHFKTYTAENPLFGKITGRYWWQPTVRGSKKKGIVHKDYELRPDPETVE